MNAKQVDERIFLEGPQPRHFEFLFLLKVFAEFIKGFKSLHFVGPCATIFGSARFNEEHPYYKQAVEAGNKLSLLGFTIITGGGAGIMEAANRGAKANGGKSIGLNIVLEHEQYPNKYLDTFVNIKYFFVRKVLLSKYSFAFVVFPGGYGTLDEFFEALALIQTGKIKKFPVVLIGKEFHKYLYEHLKNMSQKETIDKEDLNLLLFTDDIDEAIQFVKINAVEKFNLIKN